MGSVSLDATVVVATFGSLDWLDVARRAIDSVRPLDVPVVVAHGRTLHAARNAGLAMVDTGWVTFLDADDELEAGYFDAMVGATADLRAPAVRYVRNGHAQHPAVPKVAGHTHQCTADCLAYGNWLVIGSTVRTDLLRQAGGFDDYPWSEDWSAWVRCWQAGATIEAVPEAIYRAHVRADSRNRAPSREAKLAAHRAIAEAHGLPIPA